MVSLTCTNKEKFICFFITLSSNAPFLVNVMITTKFLHPVEGLYNLLLCHTNVRQSLLILAQTTAIVHFYAGYSFQTLENKLFLVVMGKCVAKLSEHIQISIRFLESNSSPNSQIYRCLIQVSVTESYLLLSFYSLFLFSAKNKFRCL